MTTAERGTGGKTGELMRREIPSARLLVVELPVNCQLNSRQKQLAKAAPQAVIRSGATTADEVSVVV